tara:strand:- start:53 stop:232 length:180 start_codon:yes stop_codon:yes gene_type:complete
LKTLDENLQLSISEVVDQFDDDMWVELIIHSPQSVKNICMFISLDLQIEKEYNEISKSN